MSKKTLTISMVILLLLQTLGAAGAFAATLPNLSGIWSGEYDPTAHCRVTDAQSSDGGADAGQTRRANLVYPQPLPGLPTSPNQSPDPVTIPFKIKIYYLNHQARLGNLEQSPQGRLIFFDYAKFCLAALQRKQPPAASPELDLPLSRQGLFRHGHAAGPGYEAGVNHEITSDISLSRDEYNDILSYKMLTVIKTTTREEGKIKTNTVTLDIAFPLNRDTSNPDLWTDEEIGCLLTAAETYPLTQVLTTVAPGNGPLARVATIIMGNRREGYLRLFRYTARQYKLSTPHEFDIDMSELNLYGYYRYALVGGGSIGLCPLAFSFNPLFLASSYIHEYTHYLQHANSPTPEKLEREIEAHCVQKEWIANHPEIPGPLQKDKAQQLEQLDAVFTELFQRPLQCRNGVQPRNWIRAEIAALTGTGAYGQNDDRQPRKKTGSFTKDENQPPSHPQPGRDGWRTVIE
ncbi:MAG: hypothetical protein JXR89_03620 [Deltaproteobacteria bacterium]|nr:hypothetical protein [Deltaproteobacteria bacterium]